MGGQLAALKRCRTTNPIYIRDRRSVDARRGAELLLDPQSCISGLACARWIKTSHYLIHSALIHIRCIDQEPPRIITVGRVDEHVRRLHLIARIHRCRLHVKYRRTEKSNKGSRRSSKRPVQRSHEQNRCSNDIINFLIVDDCVQKHASPGRFETWHPYTSTNIRVAVAMLIVDVA